MNQDTSAGAKGQDLRTPQNTMPEHGARTRLALVPSTDKVQMFLNVDDRTVTMVNRRGEQFTITVLDFTGLTNALTYRAIPAMDAYLRQHIGNPIYDPVPNRPTNNS